MAGADSPVPFLGGVQQAAAGCGGLLLVGVHPGAPGRLGHLGDGVQHIARHHTALPVGVDQHHLVAGSMAGRQRDGDFVVHHIFRLFQNLLQTQPAQGHYLALNVRVVPPPLFGSEPVVVGPGHYVAGAAKVGRRHPAGVAQVPAHMVAVQVGVDDVIHRVAGADIGVVDAHVGLQVRPQLLIEVAGAVAPVGVRAGAHPGVHQNYIILALDQKDPVVELELAVFQSVLIGRPGVRGDIGEHCRRFPRRRHHIDDGGNFNIANGCAVCHFRFPPE